MPFLVTQQWYVNLTAFFKFPDTNIIISLLSAVISGIAAIIGILLAISLVVIELAANRYPYRMVRFIIEEKVGAYVIDFLIVSLLFSIWTLFLLQRGDMVPVVSIVVSLVLASLSILFVFVYRQYSLYFFRPLQGFQSVAQEARRSILTVFEKEHKLGPSVTGHLQKRVKESIQVLTDFTEVLSKKGDPDSGYGCVTLSVVLSYYISEKRFIDLDSGWFPFIKTPTSDSFYELNAPFEELALERTVEKPDTEWLERDILLSLNNAQTKSVLKVDSLEKSDILNLTSFAISYKNVIEACFIHQEFSILDRTIANLRSFANLASKNDYLKATNELYNAILLLAEKSIQGFDVNKLREVIKKISWMTDNEILSHRLPKVFNDVLLDYRKKIETEIILEGLVISPKQHIEESIIGNINEINQEITKKYYGEAFSILEAIFSQAIPRKNSLEIRNILLVELVSLRRAIVLNKRTLYDPNVDAVMRHCMTGYDALKEKALRYEVFNQLNLGCFNSIKCKATQIQEKFFDSMAQFVLKEINLSNDSFGQEALQSLMMACSLAYLYSEFEQNQVVFQRIKDILSKHFDLNKLSEVFNHMLSNFEFSRMTIEYHHWFKDIFIEITELPKLWDNRDGGKGLTSIYDHPSPFISHWRDFSGIKECAKAVVMELAKGRSTNQ